MRQRHKLSKHWAYARAWLFRVLFNIIKNAVKRMNGFVFGRQSLIWRAATATAIMVFGVLRNCCALSAGVWGTRKNPDFEKESYHNTLNFLESKLLQASFQGFLRLPVYHKLVGWLCGRNVCRFRIGCRSGSATSAGRLRDEFLIC